MKIGTVLLSLHLLAARGSLINEELKVLGVELGAGGGGGGGGGGAYPL